MGTIQGNLLIYSLIGCSFTLQNITLNLDIAANIYDAWFSSYDSKKFMMLMDNSSLSFFDTTATNTNMFL